MAFRPRLLVVVDNPDLQRLLTTTIQHMGSDAICSSSSEDLPSLVESEKFDGALIDWDNDTLNPEELTGNIRKSSSNSGIPIAILGNRPLQSDVGGGFKVGATFFLAKPFGSRELEYLLNATRGAMIEERRRYQRVAADVPILCEWKDGRRSKHITGRTLDLSSSGVLLKLNPMPQKGVAVDLELNFPRPLTKLCIKGIVVRTGPGEKVALRFFNLTKPQQEQLETFVIARPAG